MWRRVFDLLFWLGASLYFGGMMVIGVIVAPAVFESAKDAHLSMPGIVSPPLEMDLQAGGEIFGAILNRFAYVEIASLIVLLIAIGGWIITQRRRRFLVWVIAALWIVVAGLTAYDSMALRPSVWKMRTSLRQSAAAHAADKSGTPWSERTEFDALHVRSEDVGQMKAWALLAMVLLGAWRGKMPNHRQISSTSAPTRKNTISHRK